MHADGWRLGVALVEVASRVGRRAADGTRGGPHGIQVALQFAPARYESEPHPPVGQHENDNGGIDRPDEFGRARAPDSVGQAGGQLRDEGGGGQAANPHRQIQKEVPILHMGRLMGKDRLDLLVRQAQ